MIPIFFCNIHKNRLQICFIIFATLFLLLGCSSRNETIREDKKGGDHSIKLYSTAVKDSFTISLSLPTEYKTNKTETYPTLYLLDANLYFEMVAPILHKYAEVGMLPPCILVGVGYKDFETMDSLRQRDDTYPTAIPEYEMSTSGGAPSFLLFLTKELIPGMDKNYATDKNNHVLMGHSLGGYFTMYALQQEIQNSQSTFQAYIAASPSLYYNHNFLPEEFNHLSLPSNHPTKVYATFGGLEDEEDADEPGLPKTQEILHRLETSFALHPKIQYKGEVYSNLGHMDTPLPSFIKGLQWVLTEEETGL